MRSTKVILSAHISNSDHATSLNIFERTFPFQLTHQHFQMLKTPVLELSILPDFMVGFSKTSRPPKYAGTLYPADADALAVQIDAALNTALPQPLTDVKTLLLPYADYAHVLTQLATAYRSTESSRYDLIALLAPSSAASNRITISGHGFFDTPLGRLEINDYVRNELCDEDDDFFISEDGLDDAALELHLPILQRAFGVRAPFKLLPLVMGSQTVDLCTEASSGLSEIFHSKKVLLVALCNFSMSGKAQLDDYLRALAAQDHGALLRYTALYGSTLGTGLGNVAVMAKVAHALGAKTFTEFSRVADDDTGSLYLSAAFSK
jgi:AmmeMemoRadiSam system protein B